MPNDKERLDSAHAVPKFDLFGTSCLDPLVVEEVRDAVRKPQRSMPQERHWEVSGWRLSAS
jgi:hypothetical protein